MVILGLGDFKLFLYIAQFLYKTVIPLGARYVTHNVCTVQLLYNQLNTIGLYIEVCITGDLVMHFGGSLSMSV